MAINNSAAALRDLLMKSQAAAGQQQASQDVIPAPRTTAEIVGMNRLSGADPNMGYGGLAGIVERGVSAAMRPDIRDVGAAAARGAAEAVPSATGASTLPPGMEGMTMGGPKQILPVSKMPADDIYDSSTVRTPAIQFSGSGNSPDSGNPKTFYSDYSPDSYYGNPANFGNEQMHRIAVERQQAEERRKANLASRGWTDQQIERQMYPARFQDQRDAAYNQLYGHRNDPAWLERQGRVSQMSRTGRIMQQAEQYGQTVPYALAHALASNSLPTTSAQSVANGSVSLPGLDPSRIAALVGPGAGMAAGQAQAAAGRNAVDSGRDQMNFQTQQGQQGLQGQQQQQSFVQGLLGMLLGNSIATRQEDRQDRIANDAIGNPQRKQQQDAMAWLNSEAAKGMRDSVDPQQRDFYNRMLQQAQSGNIGGGQPQAGGGGQSPAPAATTQADLIRQRDAAIASDPIKMQQHLATFADPVARAREAARLYAANGQPNHPDIGRFLTEQYTAQNPNLAFGPDHWYGQFGDSGAQSLVMSLFGIDPLAQRAGRWAEQNYGIPADVATPHYRSYFNSR